MGNKVDSRTIQTKALIRRTLLELMQESPFLKVTVKELCEKAGINRGTFYLHYKDLWAVLDELENEVLSETAAQEPYHCSLTADRYTCPYGICQKVHTNPEYGAVFLDDSLTQHVIEKIAAQSKESYVRSLMEQTNLSQAQAETLFYFQLNGCLAMNKDLYRKQSKDWQESRELISNFIQGGLRRFRK